MPPHRTHFDGHRLAQRAGVDRWGGRRSGRRYTAEQWLLAGGCGRGDGRSLLSRPRLGSLEEAARRSQEVEVHPRSRFDVCRAKVGRCSNLHHHRSRLRSSHEMSYCRRVEEFIMDLAAALRSLGRSRSGRSCTQNGQFKRRPVPPFPSSPFLPPPPLPLFPPPPQQSRCRRRPPDAA